MPPQYYLTCHDCGYEDKIPNLQMSCPDCDSSNIDCTRPSPGGFGI